MTQDQIIHAELFALRVNLAECSRKLIDRDEALKAASEIFNEFLTSWERGMPESDELLLERLVRMINQWQLSLPTNIR